MFDDYTKWTEAECFYVVAIHGFQRAWLAGPYKTRAEAEKVQHRAMVWALTESGDPEAVKYNYGVAKYHHGGIRSILGEIQP
jgi:hypothetical protein